MSKSIGRSGERFAICNLWFVKCDFFFNHQSQITNRKLFSRSPDYTRGKPHMFANATEIEKFIRENFGRST